MKTKTLHRHLHPVHWHGSMYLAIAAIVVSMAKTSGEMIRALQQVPVEGNMLSSIYLRDAETAHSPILTATSHHAEFSGK